RIVVELIAKDTVTIRREQVQKQAQSNGQHHQPKAGCIPAGESLVIRENNFFGGGDSHEGLRNLNETGPDGRLVPTTLIRPQLLSLSCLSFSSGIMLSLRRRGAIVLNAVKLWHRFSTLWRG